MRALVTDKRLLPHFPGPTATQESGGKSPVSWSSHAMYSRPDGLQPAHQHSRACPGVVPRHLISAVSPGEHLALACRPASVQREGMSLSMWAPLLTLLLATAPPPVGAEQDPGAHAATAPGLAVEVMASPRWRPPLPGTLLISRPFQPPPQRWRPGHRGVDLQAAAGSRVRAAGAGVIVFAGRLADRGVVSIEHSPGVRTTYEPLRVRVRAGETVRAGGLIGWVQPDSRHTEDLHWGLRVRDRYVDPMLLLRSSVVLKPAQPASLMHADELDRSRRAGDPPTRACRSAWSPAMRAQAFPAQPADPHHPRAHGSPRNVGDCAG